MRYTLVSVIASAARSTSPIGGFHSRAPLLASISASDVTTMARPLGDTKCSITAERNMNESTTLAAEEVHRGKINKIGSGRLTESRAGMLNACGRESVATRPSGHAASVCAAIVSGASSETKTFSCTV